MPFQVGVDFIRELRQNLLVDAVESGNIGDFAYTVHGEGCEFRDIRIGNQGRGDDSVAVLESRRHDFFPVANIGKRDFPRFLRSRILHGEPGGTEKHFSLGRFIVDCRKFQDIGSGIDSGVIFQDVQQPRDGASGFIHADFTVVVVIHEREKFGVAGNGVDRQAGHCPQRGVKVFDVREIVRRSYRDLPGVADTFKAHLSGC